MLKVLLAIVFVVVLWLTIDAFVTLGLPWWAPLAILGGVVALSALGLLIVKYS